MLKAAIKHSAGNEQVKHRVISADAVSRWSRKLEELKNEVAAILHEEKEEKQVNYGTRHIEMCYFLTQIILASASRDGTQERRKLH